MSDSIRYSIVATTFNDEKGIYRYLENVTGQTKAPCEIVIADGGSKDDTVAIIKEFQKTSPVPIKLVLNGRMNIAEGYNAAIKASDAPYIGVTGIGNIYEETYFEKLSSTLKNQNTHIVYSLLRGQDNNEFSKLYNKALLNGAKGRRLEIPSNRGALVKKIVFEKVNYFYEKFIYAGEDAEFYYLAAEKGFKSCCDESAIMYWETPKSMKEFKKQVENYTIGNMQIYGFTKMMMNFRFQLRNITLLILFLIGIIGAMITGKIVISGVLVLILGAYLARKIVRIGLKAFRLQIINSYAPFIYMFKHKKYFNADYKVQR